MRKLKHFFLLISSLVLISSCKSDFVDSNAEMQYRKIAWNYLSEQQKSTVIGYWQKAEVRREEYGNTIVVSVTFRTTDEAILGPIIVFINPETETVIGIAPRR